MAKMVDYKDAEDIINFVLDKLSDADYKEILQIHGVSEQAEALSLELCWTQFFLKDADIMHWVEDASDVALNIKDVIQNAFLLNDYGNLSKELPRGCSQIVKPTKRMLRKYKNKVPLLKLADEMNEILARIRKINKSRKKYGERLRLPVRPLMLPEIDDPYVVGFDRDKDNIVKKLLDTRTRRRSVISIVGLGGLGKTTLAQKVYNSNDIKSQFDVRIWVPISQKFDLMDILRNIIVQIEPRHRYDLEDGVNFLLTKLYKTLNGEEDTQAGRPQPKKYLLVLDDIWSEDLWTQIGSALPDAEIGSRVIMITRFRSIANNAEPYKLPFLTVKMSLELLFQKAFPHQDPSKGYPDYLYEIGEQFAKKCGGLPIGLVTLGGLLSKTPPTYKAWTKLFQTMDWGTDGTAFFEIIVTSYNHLPDILKECFMYFAVFPEDHEINVQRLFRLWVAERLIPKEEFRTLESTAESFLEDLVQRNFVQVSERSHAGSITSCRLHDLIHDLAIQKAKEYDLLTIFSNPYDRKRVAKARHVAVHYSDCSELMEQANPNLRSLLCFKKPLPNCYRQRCLKVLSDMGQCGPVEFEYFHGLTRLRYCELSGISNSICFESFIGSLKFVETLDFHLLVNHPSLPDDIWKVKTLRHVKLWRYTPGPSSSADLENLQTLTGVRSQESWNEPLPKLPNVRELDIEVQISFSWNLFAEFLSTLNHLTCLSVFGFEVPQKIVEMQRFPFYHHLQSLTLVEQSSFPNNKLSLEVSMFPIHVTELTLMNLQFQDDPLPVLEKLPHLRMLWLQAERANRKMSCSAQGFPQLREFMFYQLTNLEEWEIEAGAMPEIKLVILDKCDNLGVPLGLQYLSNLKKLIVLGCQQLQMQSNEIRDICKHVPNISFKG